MDSLQVTPISQANAGTLAHQQRMFRTLVLVRPSYKVTQPLFGTTPQSCGAAQKTESPPKKDHIKSLSSNIVLAQTAFSGDLKETGTSLQTPNNRTQEQRHGPPRQALRDDINTVNQFVSHLTREIPRSNPLKARFVFKC